MVWVVTVIQGDFRWVAGVYSTSEKAIAKCDELMSSREVDYADCVGMEVDK